MKSPLKTSVFLYAMKHSPFTIDELMKGLTPQHGCEKQFKVKLIEKYLIAYGGVNVIVPVEDKGSGTLKFAITKYGSQNMKYIPEKFLLEK